MNLYYVRHGKTQGNIEKRYVGQTDMPLIEEGVQDAIRLGQDIYVAGLTIDVIYSSSLKRQYATAQLIAKEIGYDTDKIIVNELLRERGGGNFEGKPQSDFFAMSEEEQIKAGAESLRSLADRAIQMVGIAEETYPGKTVLFVGSAAIGEMMRAMIKYDDPTKMFDEGPLPNTTLVKLI